MTGRDESTPPCADHARLVKEHEETMRRQGEAIEKVDQKLDTVINQQAGIQRRMQGIVDTVLTIKSDINARTDDLKKVIDEEREERRRGDDSTRETVRDLARDFREYRDDCNTYRMQREDLDHKRDIARGLRGLEPVANGKANGKTNGEPRGLIGAVAKAMMQPWWWAMVFGIGGVVMIQKLIDLAFNKIGGGP